MTFQNDELIEEEKEKEIIKEKDTHKKEDKKDTHKETHKDKEKDVHKESAKELNKLPTSFIEKDSKNVTSNSKFSKGNLETKERLIKVDTKESLLGEDEFTTDLMREILSIDEEDLKLIIGNTASDRKVDVYKK